MNDPQKNHQSESEIYDVVVVGGRKLRSHCAAGCSRSGERSPSGIKALEDTGFEAFDAGSLAESWRQQPGAPCYCTDLTIEELPGALAAAKRARLPKRLDLSITAPRIPIRNMSFA